MAVKEVDPVTLKTWIEAGKRICLIDVRQPEEHQLTSISPSTLIPLDQLQDRLDDVRELVAQAPDGAVIYCRSGGRSGQAISWLATQGIDNLINLRGGVNAYSREADSSVKSY